MRPKYPIYIAGLCVLPQALTGVWHPRHQGICAGDDPPLDTVLVTSPPREVHPHLYPQELIQIHRAYTAVGHCQAPD